MSTITVYTTDHCSRCVAAKMLLTRRGLRFEEINLAKDPDGRAALLDRTGMITFPQILIGEHVIGGFDELREADRDGRLSDLAA